MPISFVEGVMIEAAIQSVVTAAVSAAVAPLIGEIAELRRALDARLPERWVTRAEAAEALGCSIDSVDRQIDAGLIQSRKIGTRGVRVRVPTRPEVGDVTQLAREARTP